MIDVIRSGTARRAFAGAKYQVAGKTGTAQVYSLRGAKYNAGTVSARLRDHALFMAYAPAENPEIALALIVENGGWGATIAAPIARQVFDFWLLPESTQTARRGVAAGGPVVGDPAAGDPAAGDPEAVDAAGEQDAGGESLDAIAPPEDLPITREEPESIPADVAPIPTMRIREWREGQ